MRMSQLIGKRFKERPAGVALEGQALLLRGGYVRQAGNGLYALLPPGVRLARKIEAIIRGELDAAGYQEIALPLSAPPEMWDETRQTQPPPDSIRFRDGARQEWVLGASGNAATVAVLRNELQSHAQLPGAVYAFRDEIRGSAQSGSGLVRAREGRVAQACAFHSGAAALDAWFEAMTGACENILAECGLPRGELSPATADPAGTTRAIIVPAEHGPTAVFTASGGAYCATWDAARAAVPAYPEAPRPLEKVHTPDAATIADVAACVGVAERQTVKAVFYERDKEGKPVVAILRGDRDVNEVKIARILGVDPVPASPETIAAMGAAAGYGSPLGLDPRKVRIIADETVRNSNNLVAGANEEGYHYKNFNLERDVPGLETVDIVQAEEGDPAPEGQGALTLQRGIEAAFLCQMDGSLTDPMGTRCSGESGASLTPLMGALRLDLYAVMAAAAERCRTEHGVTWPENIAPWQVHVHALKPSAPGVREAAETLYAGLRAEGLDALYDDRDARPGVQFADADLLGAPQRLIVSERNLAQNQVEYKRPGHPDAEMLPLQECAALLRGRIPRNGG